MHFCTRNVKSLYSEEEGTFVFWKYKTDGKKRDTSVRYRNTNRLEAPRNPWRNLQASTSSNDASLFPVIRVDLQRRFRLISQIKKKKSSFKANKWINLCSEPLREFQMPRETDSVALLRAKNAKNLYEGETN